MKRAAIVLLLGAACATNGKEAVDTAAGAAVPAPRPETQKSKVTDTYHGVEVAEDYRWLEDWNDDKVKAWSKAQNTHARAYLDGLPAAPMLREKLTKILEAKTSSYWGLAYRKPQLFAIKRQPPKQQPFLIVREGWEAGKERVLVDPNEIDKTGATHIDWFSASSTGKYVAVSTSVGGTESGDVHVYEAATGKEVFEVIPGVNGGTAGGDLAWMPDDSGFFYTRYPRGDERPKEDMAFYQQLYFHQLGTPTAKDRYELGKDLPKIAEIQLNLDQSSGRLLVTVQKGDGGEFSHFLREKDGKWTQFSEFGDKTLQATFGPREDLYVLTRKGAPRGRLVRIPVKNPDMKNGDVVLPQSNDAIVEDFWGAPTILATKHRLYVTYQLGGPSEIRMFDLDGKSLGKPEQPAVSSVGGITPVGNDDILFRVASYVSPSAWMHLDAGHKKVHKTAMFSESVVDYSNAEVVREVAISKDGTKVPLNIIKPKGLKLDGSHPCVVYGYGGYGVNLTPRYRPTNVLLLEKGVVYVEANLRGGGEFGEEWHRQGNLTNKQNVFDDFSAAVKFMIDNKYTNSNRVAIVGGSNGGLLMGATMTQHPQLAKAVVSYVGIYDMLRVELSANGSFNIPEFGTVKNEDHFKAMFAYSPYHNVKDGESYPATLFLTGENDPRVDPMQSRKMTARLQAATAGAAPILLRTSSDSGHGGGTALKERIAQSVDHYAFLFAHLGVEDASASKN